MGSSRLVSLLLLNNYELRGRRFRLIAPQHGVGNTEHYGNSK